MPAPIPRRRFLAGVAGTAAAGTLAACSSPQPTAFTARHAGRRYGGALKVGLTGGSSSDTLDPHKGVSYLDTARAQSLYEPLVQLDPEAGIEYVLAAEITPRSTKALQWIIRLRPGVLFHDGKPLTASDVIYTFQRIIKNMHPVASPAGTIIPFTMRVDQAPFNDVRVRQAMRLLVDRSQMVDSALDGFGIVANDVFSPYDPDFDAGLVRHTDVDQAKSLLKAAGHENLTVTVITSPIATATVAMATVLAEQAKAAGVTIKLQNIPSGTFFGPDYLKWTFAQDFYSYSPYLAQVTLSMLPTSPWDETHWADPGYIKLYGQANATLDPSLRKEITWQMEQIDFNQGGYIVPAFINSLDAYSTTITGYAQSRLGQPLEDYAFARWAFIG